MPDYKGSTMPRGLTHEKPKTPRVSLSGNKKVATIDFTLIESLMLFNMVRFNTSHDKVEWDKVAEHSNLKNGPSARVRFRQIMKKHGLMDYAPETPRQQARKRKAAQQLDEGKDEGEDGDASYAPKPATKNHTKRKIPAQSIARSKKQKKTTAEVEYESDEQEHEHEQEDVVAATTATDFIVAAPSPAANAKLHMEPKTEGESDSNIDIGGQASVGGIDGTNSVSRSPQESAVNFQTGQRFGAGMAYLHTQGSGQGSLQDCMANFPLFHLQSSHLEMLPLPHDSNDPFAYSQPLDQQQLLSLHASQSAQPRDMTREQQQRLAQAERQQFERFQAIQRDSFRMQSVGGFDNDASTFSPFAQMPLNEHYLDGAYNGAHFFSGAQFAQPHDWQRHSGSMDGHDERDEEENLIIFNKERYDYSL